MMQTQKNLTFAEKVKYTRGRLLLTQEELAKKIGVSFATVNRWESQSKIPRFISRRKFYSFCEKMGIDFSVE